MHKLFKPEDAPADYNMEEGCPYCDSMIPVQVDNDCFDYKSICPVCGKPMMLCTLCVWDQEEYTDCPKGITYCDWTEKNGCFRSGNKKNRT